MFVSNVLPYVVALGFMASMSDAKHRKKSKSTNEALPTKSDFTPVFLFAGQSNMLGSPYEAACRYTEESGGGECNENLEPKVFDEYALGYGISDNTIRGQDLESIRAILSKDDLPHVQTFQELKVQMLKVAQEHSYDVSVAKWEAANMIELQIVYPDLFDSIMTQHDQIYCSLNRPAVYGSQQVLVEGTKLSPSSGCGDPWGLEQSFARTFSSSKKYAIAKVAEGGTSMRNDWSPTRSGYCWDALQKQARNIAGAHPDCPRTSDGSGCKWQGLVFFQGENDMFDEWSQARLYGQRLKIFVTKARQEMFYAGSDPSFSSASEIPVVIVQLGCWPATLEGANGEIIMQEQVDFVKQDGKAALVHTDDLSCYYHFDTASHLIIGERVAKAMDMLLGSAVAIGASGECASKNGLCYDSNDCCGSMFCNEFHQCAKQP